MKPVKWPYAAEFSSLIRQFHEVGPRVELVFKGSTLAMQNLHDPTKPAPSVVANHPHTNGDFLCWLQLPLDWNGSQWSFGRVVCRSAPPEKLDAFCRVAEKAGACLRKHIRFRDWLKPVMDYTKLEDRLPQLLDGEDIARWLALLLMKPEVLKPQVKHGAAIVEIADAATLSERAIRSWKLASDVPMFPVQREVIRAFALPVIKTAQTSAIIAIEHDKPVRRAKPKKSLVELDEFVLLALGELKAFDKDTRRKAEQVATHLDPKNDRSYVKKPLAKLRRLKLADSHRGANGGSWLTAKGKRRFDAANARR